jgi:hypothetical protein
MATKDPVAVAYGPGHGLPVSSTAQDCLAAAVTALAGHGALKDRIVAAWSAHLELLDPLLLPGDVRAEFILLGALLHATRALPGDTALRASVRKLSPLETEQCAAFLVRALASTVAQATLATREAQSGRDEESARVTTLRIAGTG